MARQRDAIIAHLSDLRSAGLDAVRRRTDFDPWVPYLGHSNTRRRGDPRRAATFGASVNPATLVLGILLGGPIVNQAPSKFPPVFGTEVENVYIDAFVSLHATPVSGLVASDFELRDNGVI